MPSPPPDSLLLRPFTNKAHAATFVDTPDDGDMPPLVLAKHRRVLVPGQPSIVHSGGAFKSQLRLFTRGSLTGLNWNGILLAGGACLVELCNVCLVHIFGADAGWFVSTPVRSLARRAAVKRSMALGAGA